MSSVDMLVKQRGSVPFDENPPFYDLFFAMHRCCLIAVQYIFVRLFVATRWRLCLVRVSTLPHRILILYIVMSDELCIKGRFAIDSHCIAQCPLKNCPSPTCVGYMEQTLRQRSQPTICCITAMQFLRGACARTCTACPCSSTRPTDRYLHVGDGLF